MKIIYEQDDNTVAIMAVASTITERDSILNFGKKFVPTGKPFKIVEDEDLPDSVFWEAWRVDFTEHDGIGESV